MAGYAEGTGSSRQVKLLYDRLVGEGAITAVVDQFVANVAADARINGRFATTDIPHAGMKITNADFEALVEDLVRALNKFRVPEREQRER